MSGLVCVVREVYSQVRIELAICGCTYESLGKDVKCGTEAMSLHSGFSLGMGEDQKVQTD